MANNNINYAQKHIKAFNKYLARHLDQVSDLQYEVVTDLIGNLTSSGFGKAGTKFLESLSNEELLSYLSDIDAARAVMAQTEESTELLKELIQTDDPKSALWRMHERLYDKGNNLDSNQTKALADGTVDVDYKEALIEMSKLLNDDYGLSDFTEWFEQLPTME